MEFSLVLTVLSFAKAHPIIAALCAALWLSAQWWQSRPAEWRQRIIVKHPRLTVIVEAANWLGPNVVSLARALWYRALHGIAQRPSPVSSATLVVNDAQPEPGRVAVQLNDDGTEPYNDSPDPSDSIGESTRGFARTGVLAALALFVAVAFPLALMLSGCPRMPPVDGCAALSVRCSPNGVPQHCDTDGRWTPVDDRCASYGNECVVTRAYSSRELSLCLTPEHAAQAREHNAEVPDASR